MTRAESESLRLALKWRVTALDLRVVQHLSLVGDKEAFDRIHPEAPPSWAQNA